MQKIENRHSGGPGAYQSGACRPFANLQHLIKEKSIRLAPDAEEPIPEPFCVPGDYDNDEDLFAAAMADVTPISRSRYAGDPEKPSPPSAHARSDDAEPYPLSRLQELIDEGRGFVVSDTPEYMEGRGYCVRPDVTRRLHRGDFSIQDHIDLHGLNVIEAKEAVGRFLRDAVTSGKRAVLIVHGRGLSSPNEPVLKNCVSQWLTTGYWRKWVIAFTSARSCDGGAGAVYVLLRSRPLTRRFRKKRRKGKRMYDA